MLRRVLIGIGVLLIVAGLALLSARAPGGWAAAGSGFFLLLAILIEHRGYKRIEDSVPGPEWEPTGERFREPGTGTQVAVYYHPATGRRRYVRLRG